MNLGTYVICLLSSSACAGITGIFVSTHNYGTAAFIALTAILMYLSAIAALIEKRQNAD